MSRVGLQGSDSLVFIVCREPQRGEAPRLRLHLFKKMGIGVFFYTRKGQFLYKISSYIITYHVAIIVYHLQKMLSCASLKWELVVEAERDGDRRFARVGL